MDSKKIRQGRKQSFPNQILKIAQSYFPTLFSFVEKKEKNIFFTKNF